MAVLEGGNGSPFQCSCLENPRHRGAWWAAVYGGRAESDTTEQLSFTFSHHNLRIAMELGKI